MGAVEPFVGREREDEERNARSCNPSDDGNGEVFGVCDRPCADASERTADESDGKAADEVAQIEGGTAGRFEDPAGSEERDEGDVGGARGDERGEECSASEILGVGNLQREHDSGERRTEDGGDARGCARHHQHLGIVLAEPLHEAALRP